MKALLSYSEWWVPGATAIVIGACVINETIRRFREHWMIRQLQRESDIAASMQIESAIATARAIKQAMESMELERLWRISQ